MKTWSYFIYRAICSVKTIIRQKRRAIIEVLVILVTCVIFVSPLLYHYKIISTELGDKCIQTLELDIFFIYSVIIECTLCYLPLFLMVVVYSISAFRIKRHVIPGINQQAEDRRNKQNKNLTKMFKNIVLVFFVLITPLSVFKLIRLYEIIYEFERFEENYKIYFKLTQVLKAVAHLNFCVNPIIYSKMHKNMKKHIVNNAWTIYPKCSNKQKTF